jgi:hypothetical protein
MLTVRYLQLAPGPAARNCVRWEDETFLAISLLFHQGLTSTVHHVSSKNKTLSNTVTSNHYLLH